MQIIKSNLIGFCNGVKHTVNETTKLLNEYNSKIYCLGEIVHNEAVIQELVKKGMITVEYLDEIPNNSVVIFRAHGEPQSSYIRANQKNLKIIDLTCGKVRLIHQKIIKNNDKYIIVIGKSNHPEVKAHISYANEGIIISSKEETANIKTNKDIYIVVQTTFNENDFLDIVEEIKKLYPQKNIIIDNTICYATYNRQKEINALSTKVNKMLIIGSRNSSNTKELYNIAKNNCKATYLITSKDDLETIIFTSQDIIGITSGASTSDKTINEIIEIIKQK